MARTLPWERWGVQGAAYPAGGTVARTREETSIRVGPVSLSEVVSVAGTGCPCAASSGQTQPPWPSASGGVEPGRRVWSGLPSGPPSDCGDGQTGWVRPTAPHLAAEPDAELVAGGAPAVDDLGRAPSAGGGPGEVDHAHAAAGAVVDAVAAGLRVVRDARRHPRTPPLGEVVQRPRLFSAFRSAGPAPVRT